MTTNAGEEVGKGEPLIYHGWECALFQPLWKSTRRLQKNLKMGLPYDTAVTQMDGTRNYHAK